MPSVVFICLSSIEYSQIAFLQVASICVNSERQTRDSEQLPEMIDTNSTRNANEQITLDINIQEGNTNSSIRSHHNFSEPRIRKNILGSESDDEEEELDSDEERLQVYRKLKQELDEDEKIRSNERENYRLSLPKLTASKDTHDSGLICLPVVLKTVSENQNDPVQEYSEDLGEGSDVENTTRACVYSGDQLDTKFDPVTCGVVGNVFPEKSREVFASLKSDKDSAGDITPSTLPAGDLMKEDIFVHNEDLDENMSPRIDWSVINFPARQTENLDDRMQLFSAGQNIGFQAEVAAEAQSASRRFWTTIEDSVETFGGLGEGEEVFGSDDDEYEDKE